MLYVFIIFKKPIIIFSLRFMANLFNDFYSGKKVLVTGHTGFKGSWLSLLLKELNANVLGYSLPPNTPLDNFVLTGLENKMTSIIGDVRNYDNLSKVFKEYNPEIVFHLAAQPLVLTSYKFPKETYDINVGGTTNILEAIRNTDSVKAGVVITTDKCYSNKEWDWGYRENEELGGYDPYSSSKAAAEIVVEGYRKSFFNPEKKLGKSISSARAGNVIGGGDWADFRLVPDCIRSLEKNEAIPVRNPKAVRPWQHVLDPIGGYLLLAYKMHGNEKYSGAWNFGPNEDSIVPVIDVVNGLIKHWGNGNVDDLSDHDAPHESGLLALDCTKAKKHLGWKPVFNLEDSLALTTEWYKNYNSMDISDISYLQIQKYIAAGVKQKW